MYREIVLDTETTGLDPQKNRIVEIGCVEIINGDITNNNFHVYINPEMPMPDEAYRIHGISEDFLKDKPKFKDIAASFMEYIGDNSVLVIHNAGFDVSFLNYELRQLNRSLITFDRIVDTLIMARRMYPKEPANLDALCNRFNISLKERDKHGALIDAKLLALVYLKLRENNGTSNAAIEIIRKSFPKRTFAILEEEIENHSKSLDNLPYNLWKKQ